ncbi:low molecular weight protein-tyrosine-phosphatase [Calothrix sp. NIES-3974]|uniref:low molecular weight protein-tyrosine-phosphatase n=1 Tax=Calothrix sp. NIES-3974 TaxID=2005462 RepID=UPI000B61153D|nr:low molecular weight protein-tyrosine-phosphatase [Calothrix sp. NIES-3974]BAZ05920.1 protein tyrosine phosphatase [Calothrix sp. NIES-3974]
MTYKILFVCLGNICRSPAAENIMNHLLKERGLSDKISCDSAGTSNYHIGSPPDRRMSAAILKKLNIETTGRARQFQQSDFLEFDLILAMDKENYENILAWDRAGVYDDKVHLICDFCTRHDLKEVPDPYYGGVEGFNLVVDLLVDACEGVIKYIENGGIIRNS